MLSRLVEFSLTQRLLVLVLTALMVVAGVMAYRSLPIDAFPDVSTTQVKIIMKAPGMTPEEVENRIVVPIEQEMLGIPHQRLLRTTSKYAIADITIDFDDGTDIYWARQQVAERLGNASGALPPQASGGMAPITTPLGEMFMFTIEGPLSLEQKRSLLDWTIRPQLRTLRGVADVNSLGGMARAFEVVPDPAALNARGVSLADLKAAVEGNNRNDGAGRLTEGEETLLVRVEGAVRSLDDLRAIVIANRNGVPVRVGDVAQVRLGSLTRYGAVTKDGKGEAVEGLVLGLRGANAQQVVAGVKDKLADIQKTLPKGVTIEPFYDRGNLVERAVGTVAEALGEAIVLVILLLLAFLGNFRAALVVSLILPLSALLTFILMNWFGLSANLMSLGGLAIAIGMLVDGAVVIVENVESHLSQPADQTRLPLLHVVYRAVREVTLPVASGIAIIIIVFFPLLTLEGLEGKLFIPVALTIVFALAASLVLALTVIPALASLLMRQGEHHESWLVKKLNAAYAPLQAWSFTHTKAMVLGALGLLALAAGAYTLLGKTFLPTMDEGDMIMQLEKLPSISLDNTTAMDSRIQKAILARVPEVKKIVARVGADEIGLDPMGLNETDTFLVLKPMDQWRKPDKDWLTDQVRGVMADFPGIAYSFTQPIDMRVSEMLTGVRGDIAIKIFGTDLDRLNQLADQTVAIVKAVPGAEDTFTKKNAGVQYLKVDLDRLAVGRLGLPVEQVQDALKTLLEGLPAGQVVEPGRRTPVLLRGGADLQASVDRFADLRLTLPDGGTVPLAQVARLERVEGPVKVDRENAQRYVVIQSNVRGRDLVSFVQDAQAGVAQKIKLPAGYHIVWGGQFENQQRAAQRLMLVVPVALGLIFLLLFSTFGSLRQAGLVLGMIPFALVGGVLALLISGQYLSVPASVGFIALLGIAVLNGVVMVTYFNQLQAQGLPLDQVVRDGAKRRLRPVLMTASITALGLVPLLFASGPGSEIQKPLAIVVIGGLVSSTLLTLLLLPILYRHFEAKARS
ncbi:efflux RND transporter permease subunit [Azospira inquinata]|uniref:Efflux RND transporter permease subunit n=1 Tax=Azospira inquinata TaxID=2785627 RepID=A0A975SP01_9RHOO|nr:CusA/CzcA family heavy metal efflux RND transporter [Azospira inquinata]QWT45095.1 efflux RND transporter permease subunit [Azospira inquinata]QWT49571.1 efflux RND transporter permease subunit [Azospira inquinata]